MADTPKQTQRVAVLTTPLGADVLNAVRFDGAEGISELFEFSIEAVGEGGPVDFNAAIGQNCTLSLEGKTVKREFCGVLTEAYHLEASASLMTYRLVLRPWLWLLSRTTDCRIFHEMSTPDIIQQIFNDGGFNDYTLRLTESYPPREYCVQYRETNLDFVCRMMEEDGIYFYFEHEKGKHTLVLADAQSSHNPIPGLASLMYLPRVVTGRSDVESVYEIITHRSLQSGEVILNDYDYEKPSAKMTANRANATGHTHDQLSLYDYPGRYGETSDGNRFARVRLEALKAIDFRRQAIGDAPALVPGGLTRLEDHPDGSQNIEYLVVGANHTFAAQDYRSSAGAGGGEPYSGSYVFQPADRPFRTPAVTPKPRIFGLQTAKVVGASGEEIDVDELGRILVRFHWDHRKDKSCRVRVAQSWSGNGWGTAFWPRIGDEVIVAFEEGDPDRPLVTGTVYNGERDVPYELPANKTKGGSGYNEIVLEDKKGSEEIGIHAQKDLNTVILNKETREIAERMSGGGAARKTTIHKGDDELTLKTGKQTIDIAKSQTTEAGTEVVIDAGTKITLKVGGNKIEITPAGISIKGTAKVDIDGGAALTCKAGMIKLN